MGQQTQGAEVMAPHTEDDRCVCCCEAEAARRDVADLCGRCAECRIGEDHQDDPPMILFRSER